MAMLMIVAPTATPAVLPAALRTVLPMITPVPIFTVKTLRPDLMSCHYHLEIYVVFENLNFHKSIKFL